MSSEGSTSPEEVLLGKRAGLCGHVCACVGGSDCETQCADTVGDAIAANCAGPMLTALECFDETCGAGTTDSDSCNAETEELENCLRSTSSGSEPTVGTPTGGTGEAIQCDSVTEEPLLAGSCANVWSGCSNGLLYRVECTEIEGLTCTCCTCEQQAGGETCDCASGDIVATSLTTGSDPPSCPLTIGIIEGACGAPWPR